MEFLDPGQARRPRIAASLRPPPVVSAKGWPPPALLLDIDGTLVDFAATPESVRVPGATLALVDALFDRLNGALALVSGRELSSIDALFQPLRLPAAAVHGAQVRLADGSVRTRREAPELAHVARAAHCLADGRPGLLVEKKGAFAVALHYRCAPAARMEIEEFADRVVERYPTLVRQPGNQVMEIRTAGCDKGQAIRTLMASPTFRGREAWCAGDDLTDEYAFAACTQMGGQGILVGAPRATVASHNLPDVDAVHEWLAACLEASNL